MELLTWVSLIDTWAYEHRQSDSKIIYHFPTLHVGDYETIVLKVAVPPKKVTGPFTICHIQTVYTVSHGKFFEAEPIEVQVDLVALENPVDGISNAIVLRAGTMLHLAEELKEIGQKYYDGKHLHAEERRDLVQFLLGKTNTIKKEILNTREKLDFEGFDEELVLLDNYIKIFGEVLEMDEASLEAIRQDREFNPVTRILRLSKNFMFFCPTGCVVTAGKFRKIVYQQPFPYGQNGYSPAVNFTLFLLRVRQYHTRHQVDRL